MWTTEEAARDFIKYIEHFERLCEVRIGEVPFEGGMLRIEGDNGSSTIYINRSGKWEVMR